MKAVLVFKGGACSLVFCQWDSAFSDYLHEHPHYRHAIENSGLNEEDFATELLKPFLASCLSMQHELRNAYQHLQSGNLSIVCSYHQSLTFVAVCGDGEESIDFMRRKVAALHALLRMSLGPVIETIADNPQAARQKFSSLFTTWCYLVKNEQCFLVEAVERLYINQASEDLSKKCVEALEDIVAKWNSPGANVAKPPLKIDHAALLSHDKLLALYSKRKKKLSPYDLLLSVVYVLERFPPADWYEKPANCSEEGPTANVRPNSVQSFSSNDNYVTSDDRYDSDRDRIAVGLADVEVDGISADSMPAECYVSPSSTPTQSSGELLSREKRVGHIWDVEHFEHAAEGDLLSINKRSSPDSEGDEFMHSPDAGSLASHETGSHVRENNAVSTESVRVLLPDKAEAENPAEDSIPTRKTESTCSSSNIEPFRHLHRTDSNANIDRDSSGGEQDASGDYHVPLDRENAETVAAACATPALSPDCEASNTTMVNRDADQDAPFQSGSRGLDAFSQKSLHYGTSPSSYQESSLESLVNSIALLADQALNTAGGVDDTAPPTTAGQHVPATTGSGTLQVPPKPPCESTMVHPSFPSAMPPPKRYSLLQRESYAVERVFVRNDGHLVPKDMYIVSVLPGISLVLFSEDLPQRPKMAQSLQVGIENLNALLDPAGCATLAIVRRRIQSVHEAIESVAKGLRESGLVATVQHATELVDHWHSVAGSQALRRELSEHLGATLVLRRALPNNVEYSLSQTLADLTEIFSELFGAPWLYSSARAGQHWQQTDDGSSSVVAALVDSVRNFLRSEVCSPDVGDFFVARAKRNFTMAQFQSSPFEGLFHFVLINRTSNYVAAPSLSIEAAEDLCNASSQQLAVAKLNAFIRHRLWDNVEWIYSQLQRAGCATTLVWDADFVFSYMLWFEDSNGVSRQIPQQPTLANMPQPIGDFDGTFYRALTNALFRDEEVQCCEMFGVHLGILPESVILKQCQRLAHFVCYYIPVETEPI